MKANTGKSHQSLPANSRATATIDKSYIESEGEQVLLGLTIHSNVTIENRINSICKKASQKLHFFLQESLPTWVYRSEE